MVELSEIEKFMNQESAKARAELNAATERHIEIVTGRLGWLRRFTHRQELTELHEIQRRAGATAILSEYFEGRIQSGAQFGFDLEKLPSRNNPGTK